ncbi:MAG: Pycsar system effector family protein [Flavobacteriaceae bacterium]
MKRMVGILEKTEVFATQLLSNELPPEYRYHNLRHTQRVVKSTRELIMAHDLSDEDTEILLLTAWLHDTGYTMGSEEHEEKSCEIATEFLTKEGYPASEMDKVLETIRATKRYYAPQNLLEEIIRDADASHFAKKSYMETCEQLREELILLGIAEYSTKEWLDENLKMLRKEHQYYTEYARENWSEGKDRNIDVLKKERKAMKKIAQRETLKARFKSESPDRGIQTLFRVTLRNHLTLSDIADTKSNILLSVNAIILSVVLANLVPKLDNPTNFYLIWPTSIFLLFTVCTMVLAVIATRPNVTRGQFSKEDVDQKRVNLLFFGNFHQMKLEEYEWAIKELLKDKDYVYSSLTKDLYFLGLVLNRKYKILRWTYTIFIIGIVISVVAFWLSFTLYGSDRALEGLVNLGF